MTFSIADMQNAILEGVRAISGVTPTAVMWDSEQRTAAKLIVLLKIVQLGSDHDREEYVGDEDNAGQLLWQLSTLQYMRVQIQVESIYNAPGSDALFVAEHIRAALRRPDLVWGGGEVINKPDINTYLHRVPFVHDGHVINAWSFETNFRAVTDFTLDGGMAAGTNMVQVEVVGADAEPPAGDQTIDRPTP